MILRRIAFHNYGPFRGREEIELGGPDATKPIVLFGALNGSGKTSLLQGLLLAMYGSRAPLFSPSRGYKDFLLASINNRVPKEEGASIEVDFDYPTAGETLELRVVRSWRSTGKGLSEKVVVYKAGEFDRGLTDSWAERVEALLPLGISTLFFFDGEKVRDLATQDETPEEVRRAIRTLLGLELPERLDKDLEILVSRVQRRLVRDESKSALGELEESARELGARRLKAKNRRGEVVGTLDRLRRKLEESKSRFVVEGGELAQQREELSAQKALADERIDKQRELLRAMAAGELPLAMVGGLLGRARDRAADERGLQEANELVRLLEQRDRAVVQVLGLRRVKKSVVELVESALASDRSGRGRQLDGPPFLHATKESVAALREATVAAAAAREGAEDGLSTLEQQLAAKKGLAGRTKTAAAPEVMAEKLEALGALEAQVAVATQELAEAEAQVAHLDTVLQQAVAQLKRAQLRELEHEKATSAERRVLAAAERVHGVLDAFKARMQEQKLDQLEQEVARCFRFLLRKDDLAERIEIDRDDFKVSLYDDEGNLIDKSRLSAGEQQLLAVAFLWGLSLASGRSLPVVIDTPLGRMDSTHRAHLVERYFPHASHQVLLLSTDEEIDEGYFELLSKTESIDRTFTIAYDRAKRGSKIRPGYFWEAR